MPEIFPTTRILDLAHLEGGDALREVVVPFAFFILLRWAEEQQREEEAIALFEGKEYTPQIPEEFSWSQISRIYLSGFETQNFHHFFRHLVSSLQHLREEGAAQTLAQAAQTFEVERVTPNPRLLMEICRIIGEFSFETSEDRAEVGSFFEDLIEKSIRATRFAGEMFSPQNITELMLEIADPKPGEKVYDPCFGTASFLSGAGRRMLAAADSPTAWENVRTNGIYGIEINPTALLIGLTRTVLAGISRPNLVLGNALERGVHDVSQKFDVILAAPPMGGKVGSHIGEFFPIRSNSLENLFVQHIMGHLAPNGRAIVAMPEGVLFRGGADKYLRQRLLTEFEVEGVISLPEGSFAPYTMVKPNLVICRRSELADYVWFQRAEALKQTDRKDKSVTFNAEVEARQFKQISNKNNQEISKALEILLPNKLWKVLVEDLAKKEFDLSVKQPKSDKVNLYLQQLRAKISQLEVVELRDIAEVISGVGYTRSNTDEEPIQTNVPLIRVTELSKTGEIKPPARFVNEELLSRSAKKRLRTGDIIVSTQGTIGKIGRVTEAMDGAVPAHGISTIRLTSGKVQPLFLLNLLKSSAYQEWLNSEAVGAVIMNLPIKRLEELPIPILSDDWQTQISLEYWANPETIDVLEFINKPTDAGGLLLADKFINSLVEDGFDAANVKDDAFQLERILDDLESRLNTETEDLYYGLSELKNIARKLSDSFLMPPNTSRFAFLQIATADIEKYKANEFFQPRLDDKNIRRRVPMTFRRLQQLSEILQKAVDAECHDLLYENGDFESNVQPSIVLVDKETEFTFSLCNKTILPLRNVKFRIKDIDGGLGKSLVEAGETIKFQFRIAAEEEGTNSVEVFWEGLQFDDEMAGGSLEHYFTATRQKTLFDDSDLGTNPYIVGSPLQADKTQQMFFGRQEIINKIRRALRTEGESTVLLMEGNRRAGKTSILNRLQLPEVLPDWIPVYFSMQEAEGSINGNGIATEEIFYTLTKKIILALHKLGYEFEAISVGKISAEISSLKLRSLLRGKMRPEFESGNSFELLDSQIEELRAVIGKKRILLMLDEFDKVHQGIQSGVTSSVVPENIRALLHKHNHISAILTGAKRIKQFREDYFSALYGLGIPIEVNALDVNSARELITAPVADRLLYQTDAREKIIELTKCQPYLVQSLCSRIFDECSENKKKIVTQKTVETATERMTADNEHFKTLFDFIPNLRGRYIACLVNDLQKTSDRITFDLISEKLLENGVQHKPKELDEDIKSLRELDVLELENNSYRIKLPLFGEWLSKNEDINAVQRQAAEE